MLLCERMFATAVVDLKLLKFYSRNVSYSEVPYGKALLNSLVFSFVFLEVEMT